MALTIDWPGRVINSSASIPDLVAFHAELRDAEDGEVGAIYPVTHTWKLLDLGGGAFFPALDFINGWVLRFPTPGNYSIKGNLGGSIVPVAGVYVERQTSAAYATTTVGGSGPSAGDVATAVAGLLVEGDIQLVQALRLLLSVAAGNATGLDGGVAEFMSAGGSTVRIRGTQVGGVRTITHRDGG